MLKIIRKELAKNMRHEAKLMAKRMDKDILNDCLPEAFSCHAVRRAVRSIEAFWTDDYGSHMCEHLTREYTELFQPDEKMEYLVWMECTHKESLDFNKKYRLNDMQRAYWRIDAVCMFAAMIEKGDVT